MKKFIYAGRKTNLLLSILLLIFMGLALATPQVLTLYFQEDFAFELGDIQQKNELTWITDLPPIQIIDNKLDIDGDNDLLTYPLEQDYELIFDVNNITTSVDEKKSYIIFGESLLYLQIKSNKVAYPYYAFPDTNITKILQTSEEIKPAIADLISDIIKSSRPLWLGPQSLFLYMATTLNFLLFMVILITVALLSKILTKQEMTFKEIFNLISFSSILPVMICFIINGFFPGLSSITLTLVNFATLIIAYSVYREYYK